MPCALRLSEAASMAMHAMGLLSAEPDRSLSTRAIATCFNVSEAHLSKVMQRLVKVGLLKSVRGPGGGFALTRLPEEVTLREVYEAIEGPVEQATCPFSLPFCDGSNCVLGHVLVEANRALLDHLSRTRLADVRKVFLDPRFQIQITSEEDGSVN